MPAYNSQVNHPVKLITAGVASYLAGSFDSHLPGYVLQISNTSLTSNVATYTVKLLNGGTYAAPIPVIGQPVTVIGTTNAGGSPAGNFNATGVVAGVSLVLGAQFYTGTITITNSAGNITTHADTGQMFVGIEEVGESITVTGALTAHATPAQSTSNPTATGVITWAVEWTGVGAATTALQGAMVDEDDDYVTIDTSTSTTAETRVVIGSEGFNFLRLNITALTGTGTLVGTVVVV